MAVDEDLVKNRVLARIRRFRVMDRFEKRRPQRITQEELANQLGLSRTTIANIENQRQQLTVPMLYRICSVLDVPVDLVLPAMEEVAVTTDAPEVEWAGEKRAMRPSEAGIAAKIRDAKRAKEQ